MRLAGLFFTAAFLLLLAPAFQAQTLDLCGCATVPGLQPFDSSNPATFPTGTSDNGSTLTIPLPPDGILRLSSLTVVNRHVTFVRNAANTPVMILVAGDASFTSFNGCCYQVVISGNNGSSGSSQGAGVGGLGGPGGFRGGDAAAQAINGAAIGGTGFGPGGGAGATASPLVTGGGGTFLGVPELTPLLGGAGGGGGASSSVSSTNCSGGGGGGGGGALLIAVNGTFTLSNYQLLADGGFGAGPGDGGCASSGGGGSGGAIRLVANHIVGASSGLFARGLNNGGGAGRVRIESVDTSAQTQFTSDPPALRIVGPTPLTNPVNPTVAITSVGGTAVPPVPQGTFGTIDIVLPAPGATSVAVSTAGVPSGTAVSISVKPRIGGPAVSQTVPLGGCDTAGACGALATFNLGAGAYVVEARATFQIP